jgi:DMSO reductase anchor subunit
MRPTFSIILFTVLSGAGYGLWFVLGVGLLFWWPTCTPPLQLEPPAATALCIYPSLIGPALIAGFVLVTAGLLASVSHLGQPLRAWRALSQWRSSWLSREGIAAILTYVPAVAIAGAMLFSMVYVHGTPVPGAIDVWFMPSDLLRPLGALLAFGALGTVYCTANIYSSLKPVRAWRNRFVTRTYLMLGLYSGTLLFAAFALSAHAWFDARSMLSGVVAILAACCALLKYFYWRDIDRDPGIGTGHATGLGAEGRVRSFEQPHTEENYLTHEMGFVLARKHAKKLRTIALIMAFAIPAALALLGIARPALRPVAAWCGLAVGLAGVFVERWLFFAEARHAVMAFYGR